VIHRWDVVGGFFPPSFTQAYDEARRRYGTGVFFFVMRVHPSDQLAAVY
jgi:hypothetical protein